MKKYILSVLSISMLISPLMSAEMQHYSDYRLPEKFLNGQKVTLEALKDIEQEVRIAIELAKEQGDMGSIRSLLQSLDTVKARIQVENSKQEDKKSDEERRLLRAMYKRGNHDNSDVWLNGLMAVMIVGLMVPMAIMTWKMALAV